MPRISRLPASIVLLALCLGSVCGILPARAEAETRTVTDMAGRSVTVPGKTTRVVCLGPGTLRLITYLEAADAVIAIESGFEKDTPMGRPYRIAHPEWSDLPTIGQASPSPQPNAEALVAARPEVIFISYVEGRVADDLAAKTGIPVVILSYGDLASFDTAAVFASLRLAGGILGRSERAEAVIDFIVAAQDDLRSRGRGLPAAARPTVYVGGLGFRGTQGITSTESTYPAFELLGARNVAASAGRAGHLFIDREQLLVWDPAIIFIDGGGLAAVRDDYRKDPAFYALLSAVQEGRVYGLLPYNYYTTNIDTALADAYYIGTVVYPERFADVDPAAKADEIYAYLVGKPVYAEMRNDWPGAFSAIRLGSEGEER